MPVFKKGIFLLFPSSLPSLASLRFLVDMRWYKQLRRYLGDDGGGNGQTGASSANDGLEEGLGGAINDEEDGLSASHPGPVDNSNILDPLGNDIREHLIENMDYQLLPSEAWEKIVEMFGIAEGQKPISRKVYLMWTTAP